MSSILFKGGRIWNGEKFIFADLLTENEKIAEIEKNIKSDADYIIDASGKTVSAGLVDIHTHFKGISCDAFGISADIATLPFGVTAAVDASAGSGNPEILNSYHIKSRLFAVADFKDNKAYLDNALKTMELYGESVIGIKAYFDEEISEVYDIEPLKEVVEFAKRHNLIVMVHSANSPVLMSELLSALRKGDILTHSYHTGKNNVSDDEYKSLKEAKNRGVIIDVGFAGHVHTDFGVLENAIKCGATPNTISSDITRASGHKRGGNYGLTMCMSIARKLGMTEEDIFLSVTKNAAKAVNWSDGEGLLRVGDRADICLLEYTEEPFDLTDKAGNHIESTEGYRNLLTVIKGEIVFKR